MKAYTHTITLYRSEIPIELVEEFDRDFEASGNKAPKEDRKLTVTVQSTEPDIEKVRGMLIAQLFGNYYE